LRLVPLPQARRTLAATFHSVDAAARTVGALVRAGVVPAALEIVDAHSLDAVAAHVGRPMAPAGTAALLIVEVDGSEPAVVHDAALAACACRDSGATEVREAGSDAEREAIWETRRELSYALRRLAPRKINHDLVVPCGRVPELFALVDQVRARHGLLIACFGHAGDGNIHVNLMVDPDNAAEMARAADAERELFEGVVTLDGSITGEHGVGFSKAAHLRLQLSAAELALMARVKQAFDPHGILNPGKMWETTERDLAALDTGRP
jgi:FAD/FMN-containing dehydrogenase